MRFVIFDLMGVIFVDGHPTSTILYPVVERNIGFGEYDAIYDDFQVSAISRQDFWNGVGVGEGNRNSVERSFLDKLVIDPDFERVIQNLRKKYSVSALSNFPSSWSRYISKKFRFHNFFDEILISGDCGLRKPSPDIYRLMAKKIGAKLEDCCLVDDHRQNLVSAADLGMQTILVVRGEEKHKDFRNFEPNHIIASLSELETIL